VHVDVNIQDGFSVKEASAEKGEAIPISVEQWQGWFRSWLEHLQPDLSPIHISPIQSYEVSLRLTDDLEVRSLNAQFRQIDQPTDVLSFAALEVDVPVAEDVLLTDPLYLGDIVISVETANQQAQQHQHSLTYELIWLASHGFLHLLGWDHPDETTLIQMLEQQVILLQIIGLKDT